MQGLWRMMRMTGRAFACPVRITMAAVVTAVQLGPLAVPPPPAAGPARPAPPPPPPQKDLYKQVDH